MKTNNEIKQYLEKWTKEDGIHLEKKVIIDHTGTQLIIEIDIASSFHNKENKTIKGFLTRNGFVSGGVGRYIRWNKKITESARLKIIL